MSLTPRLRLPRPRGGPFKELSPPDALLPSSFEEPFLFENAPMGGRETSRLMLTPEEAAGPRSLEPLRKNSQRPSGLNTGEPL